MDDIPPPLQGMIPMNAKCEEFGIEFSPDRFQRKIPHKTPKAPIESFEHYIAIIVNDAGKIEYRSSPSISHKKHVWLTEAAKRLREHVRVGRHDEDDMMDQPALFEDHDYLSRSDQSDFPKVSGIVEESDMYASHAKPKRRRTGNQAFDVQQDTSISIPSQGVYASQNTSQLTIPDISPVQEASMLHIKISDKPAWETWFVGAFGAIQQSSCRTIAKEWIKTIHPRKQSTHPYNGNYPRNGHSCPERTKPPYWPIEVNHKEPDHIDKAERIALLVHLLMNTPQQEITLNNVEGKFGGRGVKAEDLRECLIRRKEELKEKWVIIEEVIYARQQLESFEEGGYDADAVITVRHYEDKQPLGPQARKKPAKGKGRNKGKAAAETVMKCDESNEATPASSKMSTILSAASREPSDRDDMLALHTSFTSDTTQDSSHTVRQHLRPRPEITRNNNSQMIERGYVEGHIIVSSRSPDMGVEYDQHNSIPNEQMLMLSPWPTTHSTGPRISEAYASGVVGRPQPQPMLNTAQFGHDMYLGQRSVSMDNGLQMMSYNDNSEHFYPYGEGTTRSERYRAITAMPPGPPYSVPDHFFGTYGAPAPAPAPGR